MALGSSAYPDFCKAGKTMDTLWRRLGAVPLTKIQLGNELDGQAKSIRDWQVRIYENERGVSYLRGGGGS